MNTKKIYSYTEAMVSDDLIDGGDSAINAALPDFKAGAILYRRVLKGQAEGSHGLLGTSQYGRWK